MWLEFDQAHDPNADLCALVSLPQGGTKRIPVRVLLPHDSRRIGAFRRSKGGKRGVLVLAVEGRSASHARDRLLDKIAKYRTRRRKEKRRFLFSDYNVSTTSIFVSTTLPKGIPDAITTLSPLNANLFLRK